MIIVILTLMLNMFDITLIKLKNYSEGEGCCITQKKLTCLLCYKVHISDNWFKHGAVNIFCKFAHW